MTSKTPRQTKTPRERAEAALGIAERRYKKAIAARDRLVADLEAIEHEVSEATSLRAYAKQHPALQQTPAPATSTPTTKEAGPA